MSFWSLFVVLSLFPVLSSTSRPFSFGLSQPLFASYQLPTSSSPLSSLHQQRALPSTFLDIRTCANSSCSRQQGLLVRLQLVSRGSSLCPDLRHDPSSAVDRRALFALSRPLLRISQGRFSLLFSYHIFSPQSLLYPFPLSF